MYALHCDIEIIDRWVFLSFLNKKIYLHKMADFEVHCGSYQPPAAGKFARFRARCKMSKSNMADFEGHAFNTDLNKA